MAEQAEKERVKREQEQAKMLAVEKLTGAPSDGTQKKKKVQVKAKKVVLDDQGQEWEVVDQKKRVFVEVEEQEE